MLHVIENKTSSVKMDKNKKNYNTFTSKGYTISEKSKNLLFVTNLAKSQRSILILSTKFKLKY